MDIPESLQAAIEREAATCRTRDLARAVEDLSQRYRCGQANGDRVHVRSDIDAAAYAAYRLPATFGAVSAALRFVRALKPHWQPRSLLDLGAGPGTTAWAALAIFPGIESVTLVERDRRMIALGRRLAAQSPRPLAGARWEQGDIARASCFAPADLVVAAYALGEIPSATLDQVVDGAWTLTRGILLIVEPGTPAGFALIREQRRRLIAAGAGVVAPCPHSEECPMTAGDWCHFAQRVPRTALQRQLKRGRLSYEDEKFSYVALSCDPDAQPIAARVIRHPQIRSGHIYLDLCTPSGLQRRIVTRSQREAFRRARDLHWGSPLVPEDNSTDAGSNA
jgi:ribosomal protein RSM22 (predicted rRNA methylase)